MPSAQTTLQQRNRILFERTKSLGDAVYSEPMRLIIRSNVDANHTTRWGFDIVQSSAWYAVALARWCVDHVGNCDAEQARLNDILQRMCEKQDRDPHSDTYGNIIWNWSWTQVKDRNGVSFWSPETGYIFTHHRDLLADETQHILADTLALCIEGLDRHRPRWQYTNIFLLNILSRLTLAKALDRTDIRTQAETDWHTWFVETDKGGLTEYNSPTYIVTALAPLARMLPLCPNEQMRSEIETALASLYMDFCWHYHPTLHLLAGATSRSYSGDWLNNSLGNLISFQQFNAPLAAVNLAGPFVALSEYQASEDAIRVATQPKTNVTVRASIPASHIQRITHFGEKFALGVKSGPSYGPQELVLTLAYPGLHQRMVILKHQPDTKAPIYADIQDGQLLCGMVYRNPPESDGSPHNWTRMVLGPPDHFSSVRVDDIEWNGDYCAITSAMTLSLQTPDISTSFRFGFFSLTEQEPQIASYLWHQYEHNLVCIEFVTWAPSIIALTATVSEHGTTPSSPDITFTESMLT
jgi:hypothetical protein